MSTTDSLTDSIPGSSIDPPAPGPLVRWSVWVPVVLAGAYFGWLISRFSRVIEVIHLNPDAAWAPALAADLGSPGSGGGQILVGEASHLTTIWFLALTRNLPFRDLIWDGAPYLIYLAGLGLTAWACRRVAGNWPAIFSFALGLAAGTTVLLTVMVEGIRGHTFFADAMLGAGLIWAARQDSHSRGKRVAAASLLVVVAGSTLASDPLFLAVGLAPFAAAPAMLWLISRTRANRTLALQALAVSGAAAMLSSLIWRVVAAAGFEKNYLRTGYSFASPRQMISNLSRFVSHTLGLTNGYFLAGDGLVRAGRMLMAAVVVLALVYSLARFLRLARQVRSGAADRADLLYQSFWLLSIGGTLAAFTVSSFPAGPSDSTRYVIPVYLSLAALGPLWARQADWRRVATAAAVALFCLLSLAARHDLFIYKTIPGFQTLLDEGPKIVSYLEQQGLTRGYGGYFTSHQLTLMADSKVHVYPVIACRQPASEKLCPFSVNTRTSWYRPRDGRSFLVQDTAALPIVSPGPSPTLGPPVVQKEFGTITVSVYDYDLASTFLPPCLGTSTFICPAD